MAEYRYDLEERLLEFAVSVIRLTRKPGWQYLFPVPAVVVGWRPRRYGHGHTARSDPASARWVGGMGAAP